VSGEDGVMVGYRYPSSNGGPEIISIDHHGPDRRMMRRISSTNLALLYVKAWGVLHHTVITHTDADSIMAAAILTGRLSTWDGFGEVLGAAAIAADHTGAENALADMLQAIQNQRDVDLSIASIRTLLGKGEAYLQPEVCMALQARRAQREALRTLVAADAFKPRGSGVYAAYLEGRVDGELLPDLLPEATVIVTVSPPQEAGDGSLIKTRLGMAAEGMSLKEFALPG